MTTATATPLTMTNARTLAQEFGWIVYTSLTPLGVEYRFTNPMKEGVSFYMRDFREGAPIFEVDGVETENLQDARDFVAANTDTYPLEEVADTAAYVRRPKDARWTTVTGIEPAKNGGHWVVGASLRILVREDETVYVRLAS